jgi:serine/threonine protein kinase
VYEAALALPEPAANEALESTAYGNVFLLKSSLGTIPKAIVAVKYQALPDEAMLLNNLAAELALLHALSFSSGSGCPHLLSFYGAAVLSPRTCVQPFEPGSTCVAMVFEVAREGDLESRVVRARREINATNASPSDNSQENMSTALAAAAAAAAVLPWRLRVRVCQEMASALDFLHCQEIVHRDIKTGNATGSSRRFQFIDFSLATTFIFACMFYRTKCTVLTICPSCA